VFFAEESLLLLCFERTGIPRFARNDNFWGYFRGLLNRSDSALSGLTRWFLMKPASYILKA
jgi:hypothetical protein